MVVEDHVDVLRGLWEETSFQLEMHQCNPQCVEQEKSSLSNRTTPKYNLSFDCTSTALPGIHRGMEELSSCFWMLRCFLWLYTGYAKD